LVLCNNEDARKIAILIDSCETRRAANQQLFNAAFYRTKSFLRSIEKFNATDPIPKPELTFTWQDMQTKMNKMLEISKTIADLLECIKARYAAISPTDNPF